MVQRRLARCLAPSIGICCGAEQNTHALKLTDVGEARQDRRSVLVGLNIRVGSARQQILDHGRVKSEQSARAVLVTPGEWAAARVRGVSLSVLGSHP